MVQFKIPIGAIAASLLGSVVWGAAGAPWTLVQSEHFTILTDGNARPAQEVASHLETVRKTYSANEIPDGPIQIVLFQSGELLARYPLGEFEMAAGLYRRGFQEHFILMRAGKENPRVAAHEFCHAAVDDRKLQYPQWYEEGLCEFRSTAPEIGAVLPAHLARVREGQWIGLESLMKEATARGPIYYAESWAFVHLLCKNPDYAAGREDLLAEIAGGSTHVAAFQKVYGKSLDEVAADLRKYVQGLRPARIGTPRVALGDVTARPASESEAAILLSRMLLAYGRLDQARGELAAVTKRTVEVESAAARIEFLTGNTVQAVGYLNEAIRMGARDPNVFLTRGRLLNSREDVRRALELDPANREARDLLEAMEQSAAPLPQKRESLAVQQTEGEFVELDCNNSEARFWILVDGRRVPFQVEDPTQVKMNGLAGSETVLACGPQKPARVLVESVGNRITALTFR